MTDQYANAEVIRVKVDNFPPAPRDDRNSTFQTFALLANTPQLILNHAPSRRRALLTIVGVAADVVWICGTQADAQKCVTGTNSPGAKINGTNAPVELTGSDEVWVVSTTTPEVGVIAEYRAP